MAKMFYIIHPDGNYYSTDKSKRYTCLAGKEFIEYLMSPEGKAKRFYIDVLSLDAYTLWKYTCRHPRSFCKSKGSCTVSTTTVMSWTLPGVTSQDKVKLFSSHATWLVYPHLFDE